MTTLQQALQVNAWQFILVIGRQRGLSLDSNLHKGDLIAKITPALLDPANLDQALAGLPDPVRQALVDLQQAGGHCPARYLRERYGQLRPASQLVHRGRRSTTQVNLADFAPLEQLCLLGLAFLNRQTDDLFIPDDLGERIVESRLHVREAGLQVERFNLQPSNLQRSTFNVDLLCHDLTCLLALLQRDNIVPLHGRWLPPDFLKLWGQHCAVPPTAPAAKSELQTHRRRFIHYLAESAGFLSSTLNVQRSNALREPLTPLPAAWLWLNTPHSERLQILWEAWTTPDLARWRAFHLPGHTWLTQPAQLIAVVHEALQQWRVEGLEERKSGGLGDWKAGGLEERGSGNLEEWKSGEKTSTFPPFLLPTPYSLLPTTLLKRQPHLIDLVPANLLDRAELFTEAVTQLLTGPLVWLQRKDEGGRRKDEEEKNTLSTLHPSSLTQSVHPSKYALTTHLDPDPFQSTLTLTPGPGLPDPADLMVALEVGTRSGEYEVGMRSREKEIDNKEHKVNSGEEKENSLLPTLYSLLLTPASFIHAIHRGWTPVALVDALNRLVERPLSRQETDLLATWSEAAGRMTLHLATILETTDPGVITRLASTRRGRALIHRTLSPRAVVVDPTQLDQLVQRLTEQEGVPPKVQGGRGAGERGGKENITPAPQLPSSPAYLWLAVHVYQALGQHISLPARIPQAVLDELNAAAAPAELAAAELAAEQAMAALRQALDGRTPFPSWPEAGLPVAESLPLIQQAMATGQNLRLLYYSPGSDTLTRRVVEPYRLEGWGGGEMQGSGGAGEQGNGGDDNEPNRKSKIVNRKSGIPYLVGFCHHAQAERMFRLDRIREIEVVAREV